MLKTVLGRMHDLNRVKDEKGEYFAICICYENGCLV